ncbi:MAG TPA: acetamidase/formamidase family protein [Chloroflexota bacterium]
MAVHHVRPERRTLRGSFDREYEPILTIDPGDTVIYQTLDAGWDEEARDRDGAATDMERDAERDAGHALCGPVAIRGARAGDVLQIEIGAIRPGSWGWTWTGPRPWMTVFDFAVQDEVRLIWDLDPGIGVGTTRDDPIVTVGLRPFMGVMGNALAEPGPHSTTPPRAVGGNIDCRELISGSTLWLPVEVEGALFSVGDGHARQGDGEVGQTAIECPMDLVELTFHVRPDLALTMPEAETPAGYITFGFADSLDDATNMAVNRMLNHLEDEYDFSRARALALASLVVDLRVTQIVNSVSGVHALLPRDAIRLA